MTISARAALTSCLLAALAGVGTARAHRLTRPTTVPWKEPARPRLFAGRTTVLRLEPPGPCLLTRPTTIPWKEPARAPLFARAMTEPWQEGGGCWPKPCLGGWECRRWTVTADALLLHRSAARPLPVLFIPADEPPDVLALNVADLGFDFASGPRISLRRHFSRNCALEANYFGIDGWTSSAVRDGNPLILFPPGAMFSPQFAVDYGSDLYSTEVNLRHRYAGCLDLLAGLRWVELRESFHVAGPNPFPFPPLRYDTQTDNSMYGVQIGAEAKVLGRGGLVPLEGLSEFNRRLGQPDSPFSGPLRVDGFLKAGIYANRARQDTSTVGNFGTAVTAGDRRDHTAFLGEVGLTGACRLRDWLSVRGGYQVMWIEGAALAPDQIPFTDVTSSPGKAIVNAGGSLFYHGCHVGLEARW